MCSSGWRAAADGGPASRPRPRRRGRRQLGTVPHAAAASARAVSTSTRCYDTDEGWAKDTRHYWLRDWRGYAEFFFGELLPEPHSTKQHEDCVGWAGQTDAETILRARRRATVDLV